MDEYLYEIMHDAEDSDPETDDEEIPSEFYDELVWGCRGAGSFCSMDVKYVKDAGVEFGWTVAKRRRIQEQIKILNEYDSMQRALATSCKQLCKAIAPEKTKKLQLDAKPAFSDWQDVLCECKGIDECF